MKHLSKIIVIILLVNTSCFSQKVVEQKVTTDSLENYVQKILVEYNIPGVQAALVTCDKILNVVAVGDKSIGGEPITLNSVMHLGSCGKAMTGYLAGILVENNILDWNTTIATAFPEFKSEINTAFLDTTFKELLSHQSLVPQFITDKEWKSLDRFSSNDPKTRRYNFSKWVLQQAPIPFNTEETKAGFRYSNAGFSIAAAMMEKITGQPWEELMTEYVFEPLQISATFGWPATTNKKEPYGHIINAATGNLTPHNPNDAYQIDSILSPGGNMSMSILDYSKFIQKNLQGLNGFDKEYPKEFFEYLHYVNKPTSEYSIGWYSVKQFDDDVSSHTGSADTFYCLNLLLSKHNIAIIVIANSATDETKTGTEKIRNYLLRPYLTN